jgi:SAM-dependent methyltransferase
MSIEPADRPSPPAAPSLPGYYRSERPEVAALIAPQGKRILELGCAAGMMGAQLRSRGAAEVVGVELHAGAAKAARAVLTAVYRLDLSALPALPYADGHFDYIVCADVLEHLVDPEAVLRHFRRYLAPEGQVIVSLPNLRHESVVLPLLVDGLFEYRDAGILDRTHLRFFTLSGLGGLLSAAGLALAAPLRALTEPPSAYLERAAALVASLGGDAQRFRQEAVVVQYLAAATHAVRPAGLRAQTAPVDPWAGSRPMRVLLAPNLDDPADRTEAILSALVQGALVQGALVQGAQGQVDNVTFGVVLPPAALADVPPVISRAAARGQGDLLLIERPHQENDWRRLLAGASLLVTTGADEQLLGHAASVGLDVEDGPRLLAA